MKPLTLTASDASSAASRVELHARRAAQLRDLLAGAAGGDRQAFERLYRLTSPKLFALALRILKSQHQAEECLQEAFLSIWRRAGSYDAAKAAPLTWMITIVRNRALDMLREQRASPAGEWPAGFEPGSEGEVEQPFPAETSRLAECLNALREEQRRCLILAYYEGLTHVELSDRTGVPLGTVKTWIRRGLEAIRKCLGR